MFSPAWTLTEIQESRRYSFPMYVGWGSILGVVRLAGVTPFGVVLVMGIFCIRFLLRYLTVWRSVQWDVLVFCGFWSVPRCFSVFGNFCFWLVCGAFSRATFSLCCCRLESALVAPGGDVLFVFFGWTFVGFCLFSLFSLLLFCFL